MLPFKKMFNVILIILLLLSDAFIAIDTSNKLNAKKLRSQNENENEQFSTTTKKSTPITTTKDNPFDVTFEKFDKAGTFIKNDLQENQSSTAKTFKECKRQFYPMISLFPDLIQKAILSEFANNKSINNNCCDSGELIQSIGKEFEYFEKDFAEVLTKRHKQTKKGFTCFRANEVVARNEGLPLERSFINENKQFTRTMLKSQNDLSMNLLACMNQIKKISLRNVGLFCGTDEVKDKIFNKNSQKEYTSVKLFPDDEIETFDQCFEYMKHIDSFSNTVLGAYLDSLNTLIGTDKCNYLSNLFAMDPIKDKDDPLLPKDLKDLAGKVDQKDPSKQTNNSPKILLDKWHSCAKTKTEFDLKNIEDIEEDIRIANYINPNGLSTYIGRADIKYGIIKEKFNLVDYPYFQLKCDFDGCKAGFKGKQYSEMKELQQIITGENTSLKVSCCDKICVVYVKIKDTTPSDGTLDLKAAEIFEMKGDRNTLDISKLDLNELKNAQKCLSAPVTIPVNKEISNFVEILESNSPTNTTTTNTPEKPKTKNFSNQELIETMKQILEKSEDFDNDFRLKTNTLLQINLKGKDVSLNDFIYETLFKQENAGSINVSFKIKKKMI